MRKSKDTKKEKVKEKKLRENEKRSYYMFNRIRMLEIAREIQTSIRKRPEQSTNRPWPVSIAVCLLTEKFAVRASFHCFLKLQRWRSLD